MVRVVLFSVTRLDFLKSHFKGLNILFKKVVLPGRVKCGGTEGEIVVAHGCRKRKKLICGTEGEIVVAHGRLLSPAPPTKKIDCTQNFPALDWLFDLSKQHS